jgi:hypothetical protein
MIVNMRYKRGPGREKSVSLLMFDRATNFFRSWEKILRVDRIILQVQKICQNSRQPIDLIRKGWKGLL